MANPKKHMETYVSKRRALMEELVRVPYALIGDGTIDRFELSNIHAGAGGKHFRIYVSKKNQYDYVSDLIIQFRCDRVAYHVIVNRFKEMGYEVARGRIERDRGAGGSNRVNNKDHEHRFEIALRKGIGPDFIDSAMSDEAKREVRKFDTIVEMDND